MQTADASRTELRELMETYAARAESGFREFDARMDARFAQVDVRFAEVEKLIERQQGRLLAWSFGFWTTALVALYAFSRAPR